MSSIEDTDDDETNTILSSDEDTASPKTWTRVGGHMVRSPDSSPSHSAILATTKPTVVSNYFSILMDHDDHDAELPDDGEVIGDIHSALLALTSDAIEPDTFTSAINDPQNGDSWRASVTNESQHFKEKGVFTYEDQTKVRQRLKELNKKPIKAKWILKRKSDKDGNLFAK